MGKGGGGEGDGRGGFLDPPPTPKRLARDQVEVADIGGCGEDDAGEVADVGEEIGICDEGEGRGADEGELVGVVFSYFAFNLKRGIVRGGYICNSLKFLTQIQRTV